MGCGTGGYTGWGMVLGGYWGRVIPGTQPAAKWRVLPAKRAPGSPARAGVGWVGPATPPVRPHPPFGPGRDHGPSLVLLEQIAPSWPIRARIDLISYKVS